MRLAAYPVKEAKVRNTCGARYRRFVRINRPLAALPDSDSFGRVGNRMSDGPSMADEPKPKAAKKKKRRRAPPEEFVEYVVEITDWDWGYSLSLNTGKYRDEDPYHEFRHLQITGKLLRPAGLKTDAVQVSLLPSSEMSEERRKDYKPIALGALDLYPDMIKGSIGIPADVLAPILQMLIARELKFILLTGSKLRYRSARLTGLRLEMRLTDDDAPVDDAVG